MPKSIFLGLILLLLSGTLIAQKAKYVTVIAENANLRGTPSASGAVIAEVREGDVFTLINQRGSWFLVETPKFVGWLHGNTVKLGRVSRATGVGTAEKVWRRCKLPDMDVYGTCPEDVVPTFFAATYDKGYDAAIVGENKVKNPILWEKPEARDSSLCAVRVGDDPAICRKGQIEELYMNDVLLVLNRERTNNFLNVTNARSGKSGWIYVGHLARIYYTRSQNRSIPVLERPAVETRRPDSGTVMASGSYRTGLGDLTISNGTASDAIAKLIDTRLDSSYREVYIRANSSITISNIAIGNYELIFSLGRDFAPSLNKFLTSASYSKFDSSITFEETKQVIGNTIRTNYDSYSLTLNTVAGGNAATSGISEAEFTKY